MRKRTILKLTAIFLFAVWVVWLVAHFSEPHYQGKSLSAWLDKAWDNGDMDAFFTSGVQNDTASEKAIHAIGDRGVPTLLRLFRTRDNRLLKAIRDYAEKNPSLPIHLRNPEVVEGEGMYGLGVLGPDAKSAVPYLITSLDDDDPKVRAGAAYSLGLVGQTNAIPVLEKYLATLLGSKSKPAGDWDMEMACALGALGRFGPLAGSAVPQLALLAPTNIWAKAALIKISGTGLDPIIASLNDTTNIRSWQPAVFVAMELGTNGAPLIPALLAGLQNTNTQIHVLSIMALRQIHVQPERCVPAIVPFLTSTNTGLRVGALDAIFDFGSNAHPWVQPSEIVPFLSDSEEWVRKATNALRRVYPEAAVKAGIK